MSRGPVVLLLILLCSPVRAERLVVQASKTLPSGAAQSDVFIYDDAAGVFTGPLVTGDRVFDPLADVVVAGESCDAFVGGTGSSTVRYQLTTGFADPAPFLGGGTRHVFRPAGLAATETTVYLVGGWIDGVQVEARDASTGAIELQDDLAGAPERQGMLWTLVDVAVTDSHLHAALQSGLTHVIWSWDLETNTFEREIELTTPARALSLSPDGELFVSQLVRNDAGNFDCCEVRQYDGAGAPLGVAVPRGVANTINASTRTWLDREDRLWTFTGIGEELVAIDLTTGAIDRVVSPPEGYDAFVTRVVNPVDCTPGDSVGYAHGRRFTIELEWQSADATGVGHVIPGQSPASLDFWFFTKDNTEFIVKVLNACALNQHYWVFAAGLTNVAYTLRVTDTETSVVKEYRNSLGTTAPAITDTSAFATCP